MSTAVALVSSLSPEAMGRGTAAPLGAGVEG